MQYLTHVLSQACTQLNPDLLRRRLIIHFFSTHTPILNTHFLLLPITSAPLQTLHLPRLQCTEILLLHMDLTGLVSHGIRVNVLLRAWLRALGLLECRFHHVRVGELFTTKTEIYPRPHLLDLNARELLARALGAQEVEAQLDLGIRERVGRFLRGYTNEILQAFNVNLVRVLTFEEIDEQALRQGVFCLVGIFEDSTVECHKRLQADGRLFVLELLECAEGVRVDVELEHIEYLVGEGACEGHAVWALLRVQG
jgi:hypothetical protein